MDNTIEYYNQNGQEFCDRTLTLDMSYMHMHFTNQVKKNGKILDAGCGSGRDSLAFMKMGYEVEAFDGSKTMCDIAEKNIGHPVRQMLFEDMDYVNEFDGIWANASLLHVPEKNLPEILSKLNKALVNKGVLYASFKLDETFRERGDRYFNNFSMDEIKILFQDISDFSILECYESEDGREDRKGEYWVNILVQKNA